MWYTWDSNLSKLVTAADSTANRARRTVLYHQIQKTWVLESPWIGVVQPQGIVVLHKGISGYVYNAEYASNFRDITKS
jgi:ABC-type transport system substrate-binding protein